MLGHVAVMALGGAFAGYGLAGAFGRPWPVGWLLAAPAVAAFRRKDTP